MYVFRRDLQILSKTFIILRWIQRYIINLHRSIGLYVNYQLFLSKLNETLILKTYIFLKNTQILQSMKMCIVGAKILHVNGEADGQTDKTMQIVAFWGWKCEILWVFTALLLSTQICRDVMLCLWVCLWGCLILGCSYTFSGLCIVISLLNLLKPTGHVMHHQFNIQQLYVLPTLYLCVLYLSENKQRLVPLTA